MEKITDNYIFGIFLTMALFYGVATFRNRVKLYWINPLLISVMVIIAFLSLLDVPYEHYSKGGGIIHAFLGPVTVALALPLYRQRKLLVAHKYSILGGVFSGVLAALISVVGLSRLMGINELIERSVFSHSVTTPIGISIAGLLEADEGVTVLAIMITGVFGILIAPFIYKILKVVHPIARGIGLGTSAHAIGTSKAMEMGQTEGAMSSLAIGITGLTTVITVILLQSLGWY